MKSRNHIALAFITLAAVAGLLFWDAGSGSSPALVFKSYVFSTTNAEQFAKRELQNTTGHSLWLWVESDNGSVFNPHVIERPVVAAPKVIKGAATNHFRMKSMDLFILGEELRPGASRVFNFPLVSGKGPEQVGISFYVGNFKDSGEFFDYIMTLPLTSDVGLKAKLTFYWQKLKSHFGGPKYHEVWCEQPVSFQERKPADAAQTNSNAP
ncbi:MAG TPA: hypothetical protein VN048_07040 [Verrucomicrobiae bacterium]|jgi:hypothetical protein|nr:hypothetical protein [Verrucomicrobiae bacterium]